MPWAASRGLGGPRIRRAALVALLLLGLPVPAHAALLDLDGDCGSGADAPDAWPDALVLPVPARCLASATAGDEDWYLFRAEAPGPVGVYTWSVDDETDVIERRVPNSHRRTEIDVCLYDLSGHYGLPFCSANGGVDDAVRADAPHAGDWAVRVFNAWQPGDYLLEVNPPTAPQDDCGLGHDASDDRAAPSAVALPRVACPFRLEWDDAVDAFAVAAEVGETVRAYYRRPAGSAVAEACVFAPGEVAPRACSRGHEVSAVADVAGTWTVALSPLRGRADGRLSIDDPSHRADDCGLGRDADAAAPGLVPVRAECAGEFTPSDLRDDFAVDVPPGEVFSVRLEMAPDRDFHLCMTPPDGPMRCEQGGGAVKVLSDASATGGRFTFSVRRFDHQAPGEYRLSLAPARQLGAGLVIVGNPETVVASGFSEMFQPWGGQQGVDAVAFWLFRETTGVERATVTWTGRTPGDLDIAFYDASRAYIDGCASKALDTPESCVVPAGARWAVVHGVVGAEMLFRLGVEGYAPLPP